MGVMINGEWTTKEQLPMKDGGFDRPDSALRNWIEDDADAEFPAEAGRYRLYVNQGCPWAHRTLIARALLGLEDVIELCMTLLPTPEDGWVFAESGPHSCPDGRTALWQLYRDGADRYTGRATVPVLWDTKTGRIVNNESADIIRILNTAFARFARMPHDITPAYLAAEIDAVNERVYEGLNNGVYRAGFAQTQQVHDAAVEDVFDTLDWLEARLSDGREFLVGDQLTEADIRAATTLLRFNAYREVFYCDLEPESAHPHVFAFRDRLAMLPAFASTTMNDAVYRMGYGTIPFAAKNNPNIEKNPRRGERQAA